MKTWKQTVSAMALCLLLGSCGSLTSDNAIMKIQKGMSQEDVGRLLGKPDLRRFDNHSEQWEYTKSHGFATTNTIIIIDFTDGRVTNMDSFKAYTTPPPQVAVCPPSEIIAEAFPQHAGPHQHRHKAISPQDFENLYKKVKSKPFKDDQMELLSVGVAGNHFTCRQTARLMSLFTWDDEKMKVLKMVAGRIVDPENGNEIAKTLDSLFKQDEVRDMLKIPQ